MSYKLIPKVNMSCDLKIRLPDNSRLVLRKNKIEIVDFKTLDWIRKRIENTHYFERFIDSTIQDEIKIYRKRDRKLSKKIDILYPIGTDLRNKDFFERLKFSIKSLSFQTFKNFSICICDTSPKPAINILKSIIDVPFRYIHKFSPTPIETGYGYFSKPFTINFGVRNLVNADFLKISDVDIVYPKDHLEFVLEKMEADNLDVLTYAGWKLLNKKKSPNFSLLRKTKGEYLNTPGIPTMRTEVLHAIRGYNEHPDFVGLEDVEFLMRCRFAMFNVLENWPGTEIVHLWHEKTWPEGQTEKDKNLYWRTYDKLSNGILKPYEVNLNGFGENRGILI